MYMIEFLLRNERHVQHFDTRAEMQERIKFLEWWYNDDFRLISED